MPSFSWPVPTREQVAARSARARRDQARFRQLNLSIALPILIGVGGYLAARQAQTWVQALVLLAGVAAAVVAFERWTAGQLARVAVPALLVTGAVWAVGAGFIDGTLQSAFFGISLVGGLTVAHLARRRAIAAAALLGFVALVGAVASIGTGNTDIGGIVAYVLTPTAVTAVVLGTMVPNKGFYDVVAELEDAREKEAELAVVRERMRFASELHDIQGHTLHLVKLKMALARRLVRDDPDRAEQELAEMYELVGDTISQTKELAYGQRRLNLTAEVANARQLLEAAGIRADVVTEEDPRVDSVELLAQVLREATTNVLRHSRATSVRLTLSRGGLELTNDGAPSAEPRLHGLATLEGRVDDVGGELTVHSSGGEFTVAVTFPTTESERTR